MTDLSVMIPARNEEWLAKTIDDILTHAEGDTEVIAVLDGEWANPPIPQHPRVTVVYHPESVGQRAATNEAARISEAEFVMKADAHCAFDQGFDVKMMAVCEPGWICVPRMYNLEVFNWRCPACGEQWYMGPDPKECKNKKCTNAKGFEKVPVWEPRRNRKSDFMRFDSDLRFQYWGAFERRPEGKGDVCDLMCFIGACWMARRDTYWAIGGCDEGHGSWGQMGVEMACKGWLSGGRVVVNKSTWFAHMFRTRSGFAFPYPMRPSDQEKAREYSRGLWRHDRWEKAVHPLSWLVEKFWPVPGWTDEDLAALKADEHE